MEITASAEALTTTVRSPAGALRRVLREPAGTIGILIVSIAILVAILAPWLAPHDPSHLDASQGLLPPSASHLLGTDGLGRDNLSRVLYGTRYALGLAVSAIAIAFVAGVVLGVLAGYLGGVWDRIVLVVCDSLLAFPSVILALALLSLMSASVFNTVIVIAVAYLPYYARVSRGQTLAIRSNSWFKAERALGASNVRILIRHVLPNIVPPLVILIAMDIPGAIAIEAGLAYLGLGVPPPAPDWGVMLSDGFSTMGISIWPLLGPVIGLLVVSLGFTLIGETFRDVVDPNLPERRRRRLALPRLPGQRP